MPSQTPIADPVLNEAPSAQLQACLDQFNRLYAAALPLVSNGGGKHTLSEFAQAASDFERSVKSSIRGLEMDEREAAPPAPAAAE